MLGVWHANHVDDFHGVPKRLIVVWRETGAEQPMGTHRFLNISTEWFEETSSPETLWLLTLVLLYYLGFFCRFYDQPSLWYGEIRLEFTRRDQGKIPNVDPGLIPGMLGLFGLALAALATFFIHQMKNEHWSSRVFLNQGVVVNRNESLFFCVFSLSATTMKMSESLDFRVLASFIVILQSCWWKKDKGMKSSRIGCYMGLSNRVPQIQCSVMILLMRYPVV